MASTRTKANAPGVTNWSVNQNISDSEWTEVWSSPDDTTNPAVFIQAVFQLNTTKMAMRVLLNDVPKLDVDLDEMTKDFKLKKELGINFPIMQYESNLWVYTPTDPLTIPSGERLVIALKSDSKTKKLVRGMSEWGEL